MRGCFIILVLLALLGCGLIQVITAADKDLVIQGKEITVSTYGVFNEDTHKNELVVYEVSPGSVIISIIFSETLIIPIYLVGWNLYQPVRAK